MWKKILDKNLIVVDPEISSKHDLFENMVNHAYNNDYLTNRKTFLTDLREREKKANTELIDGVAFPHARSESVEQLFLSIILIKKGLDYDSSEFGPVRIVFFFGCPENKAKEYLQLLAKSSRMLKIPRFREELLKCENSEQVIAVLDRYSEEEKETDDTGRYLIIFTLFDTNLKQDVMSAMVEAGVTNASVISASSLARMVAYEMPIFAGLSYMAQGKSTRTEMILGLVEDGTIPQKLAHILKQNEIDIEKKGVGYIQCLKIESIIGNFEEDIEI